ncbi:hypothetical protein SteCoe_29589 [Stentor coeruleus]|uniref:MORN repeat protein n=1 Tax=Stentor coeruleus TaxID=5963 RepID=A0A1R2B5M2_9CILI|nr:hypothetical protein SteCoe_29589 [Stentor coeruleus]
MGGACSCFQSPNILSLKTEEAEYIVNVEAYSGCEINNNISSAFHQGSILKRLLKQIIVKKYIKTLKNPSSFRVKYPISTHRLEEIQSELIKSNEAEYGDFRITPVWGELTIPLPLIEIDDFYYQGEWDFTTKQPHGAGTSYNRISNEKFSGNFKKGKRNALGRLILANGDLYEGEFYENEMHGNGTLLHFQGKVYIGEFRKGFKEGYGKEQDRHESCYEGDFVKNKRHGNGKLIWADGRIYTGEFFNDKMHGLGECWWPEGKRYYGQWANDKQHGEGQCIWDDGREFIGQYFKGQEDGSGKMLMVNGDIYDGMWKRGKQHGNGTIKTGENEKKGLWEDGNFVSWAHE